jgi:hypothetical protein
MRLHQGWFWYDNLAGLMISHGSGMLDFERDVVERWAVEGSGTFYDILKPFPGTGRDHFDPALYMRLYTRHDTLITQGIARDMNVIAREG